MNNVERLAKEHTEVTRSYFLKVGAAGAALGGFGLGAGGIVTEFYD